jgi:hypothetical protein
MVTSSQYKETTMKSIVLTCLLGVALFGGIFEDVASFNKGVDGYVVGKALTEEQKALLEKHGLQSDDVKVRKFLASDHLLVAVEAKSLKVLAINKRYNQIDQQQIRSMIGNLIHDYDEPTAMAHDKMIYWIYDDKGEKLTQDDIKKWKESLKSKSADSLADMLKSKDTTHTKTEEFNPYLSIKLSSDQPMMSKQKEEKPANAYLIISSDKLITTAMHP